VNPLSPFFWLIFAFPPPSSLLTDLLCFLRSVPFIFVCSPSLRFPALIHFAMDMTYSLLPCLYFFGFGSLNRLMVRPFLFLQYRLSAIPPFITPSRFGTPSPHPLFLRRFGQDSFFLVVCLSLFFFLSSITYYFPPFA